MDAMGKDIVLVETVGVGQDEVEIVNTAHTSIVVLVPGLGDDIQAIKAGIIEIGDIHVVNKMDKGGEEIALQIDLMLDTDPRGNCWRPPVLLTNGITGEGVDKLLEAIWYHRAYMEAQGELAIRKERIAKDKIVELVKYGTLDYMLGNAIGNQVLNELTKKVSRQEESIYSASERILDKLFPRLRR
jgi:LAO/AO transport system kinase